MKLLSIFLLTLVLGNGCDSTKQTISETAVLEYTANTRGFYEKITISNREATVTDDREGIKTPTKLSISDSDWDQLATYVAEANLDGLSTLKAPSEQRFYDGAAIAKLKITWAGKVYETPEFDHGMPNAAIEKLVTKINQYSRRK